MFESQARWTTSARSGGTRVAPMWQAASAAEPTTTRQRQLPTENSHAALHSGATREYQSDSSSKQPRSSVVPDCRAQPP